MTKRRRIAVDAASIGPEPSGARTRMVALLRAYVELERRHSIVLLAPERSRLEADFAGVDVEVIPVPPPRSPLGRLTESPRNRRELLDRHHVDLLQVETLPVPRDPGRPMLLTLHDLRDLDRAMGGVPLRRLYASWLLPRELRRVARVIAVSDDTARRVARLGVERSKIDVVPNAPDPNVTRITDASRLAEFRARYRLNGRVLLALGHIEGRKNLGLLVEVARRLRSDPSHTSTEPLTLLFMGRDLTGEGARLRRLADRKGVSLVLTGSASSEDRNIALSIADVLAVPSHVEGFGIVPLEGMVVGTPVVVASTTALPEVVGSGARCVASLDPDEWVAAIRPMLLDAELRSEWIVRGERRAREYSWSLSAVRLRDVHDRVVGS